MDTLLGQPQAPLTRALLGGGWWGGRCQMERRGLLAFRAVVQAAMRRGWARDVCVLVLSECREVRAGAQGQALLSPTPGREHQRGGEGPVLPPALSFQRAAEPSRKPGASQELPDAVWRCTKWVEVETSCSFQPLLWWPWIPKEEHQVFQLQSGGSDALKADAFLALGVSAEASCGCCTGVPKPPQELLPPGRNQGRVCRRTLSRGTGALALRVCGVQSSGLEASLYGLWHPE